MNPHSANKTEVLPSAFPDSCLFLHAAAVLSPEGVILLMGHSSSGKTTLSSLLSSHFPVVADDRTFVFRQKSGAWAVTNGKTIQSKSRGNSGFSGNIRYDDLQAYPLHSFIRIFAAQHTELEQLPSIKMCEYLMDAVFEIDDQRNTISSNLTTRWFHLAADMAKQYPGWKLMFTLDEKPILSLLKKD